MTLKKIIGVGWNIGKIKRLSMEYKKFKLEILGIVLLLASQPSKNSRR